MINQPEKDVVRQPSCVAELLDRLSEAADCFQSGKALGPYLIETLMENVGLCPALEQTDDVEAHARLEEALEKTRQSIRVAMACPTVKRDWAAQELRAAVTQAQECLDQWRASVLSKSDNSDEGALLEELKQIDSPRCHKCAFAHPALK